MAFLIPRETELSYISGSSFQSLKSKLKKDSEKISYISGNGTF